MKFFLPASAFVFLSALAAFMKAYGWSFIAGIFPFISAYRGFSEKTLTFIAGIAGLWLLVRIVGAALERIFEKTLKSSALARKLLPLLRHVVTVLVIGFGIFFLLSMVGVNINALLTGAGVWGLVFALASKEIASNLFGSLSLVFGKFFKISDRIRIRGFEGMVEEITLSHTKLIDQAGHTVFMPNKFIVAEPIENLSDSVFKRAKFSVSIPSGVKSAKFAEALAKIAEKRPGRLASAALEEIASENVKFLIRLESSGEDLEAFKAECLAECGKWMK